MGSNCDTAADEWVRLGCDRSGSNCERLGYPCSCNGDWAWTADLPVVADPFKGSNGMRRKVGTLDLDRWLLPLLILNLLVWVVARFISDTNLDPYGDMLENFAWGQEFSWGTHKHPPLIGWVTALWFSILPRNDTAYHLLSYLNVLLGLVGVYRVAIVLGFARVAVPTVLLLAMALPYSTLAVKFNANAILLSLWPWVVFGWLKSQQETDTNVTRGPSCLVY